MLGKISVLGNATLFGLIRTESGLSVRFDHSSVMTYDLTGLALDQAVSFDIENGLNPRAINVRVLKAPPAATIEKAGNDPIRLRYMGFEQTPLAREFRFDQLAAGAETAHLVVKIAMTLFTKHRVGIQEGPALCLHALQTESKTAGGLRHLPEVRSLADADAQGYLDSKVAAEASSHRNRSGRTRPAAMPTGG